ncbi:Uncharacterised protein [Mycobacteroides abscessus subsp. abscessus]|nr:Uncharacterised protein [Mycobacteroides abscessus subsp. abscessus]
MAASSISTTHTASCHPRSAMIRCWCCPSPTRRSMRPPRTSCCSGMSQPLDPPKDKHCLMIGSPLEITWCTPCRGHCCSIKTLTPSCRAKHARNYWTNSPPPWRDTRCTNSSCPTVTGATSSAARFRRTEIPTLRACTRCSTPTRCSIWRSSSPCPGCPTSRT